MDEDAYSVLGVSRDASAEEIRRSFRKQALLSHPDKNLDNPHASSERFRKVAAAYDVLGDEHKRAAYDRGESAADAFDFESAEELFNAQFGHALMQRWSPGLTVTGTIVAEGRRLSITILPDGATEEHECAASRASSLFMYMRTTTAKPGGGRVHTVLFRTFVGERLADLLIPPAVSELAWAGPVLTAIVSWLPTVLAGCVALRVLNGRARQPGELPDTLVQAFRHLPPGDAPGAW